MTVLSAVSFPVLLLVYMFAGHCAIEDIMLYSPTKMKMFILLMILLLTIISLAADKLRKKPVSTITLIISFISLAVCLYLTSHVVIPKYIRHGDMPKVRYLESGDWPRNKPFRFAAAGDSHIGNKKSQTDLTVKMADHIRNDHYDAFFLLGDLVDHGFDDRMWKEAFAYMAPLNQTTPVCYVPGNHDTMFGGDALYKKYAVPDKKDNSWKRMDIGNIHFLILDIEWRLQTYTKDEEQWLIQQLRSIPAADWCIVMLHTFLFCSGKEEKEDGWLWYDSQPLIDRMSSLLEQNHVDLVLSGHKHQIEVLENNDLTYVVMGAFGGQLSSNAGQMHMSPASIWFKPLQYGFVDVSIQGNHGVLKIRNPENRIMYSLNIRNR